MTSPRAVLPRLMWRHGPLRAGEHPVPEPTWHYLTHVLRLQAGAALEVCDGRGLVARATLGTHALQCTTPRHLPEPGPHLTLACAIPKGERADWLVEKATEVGVQRLIWVAFARSVTVDVRPARHARWERLIDAAGRQAGRTQVPTLEGPIDVAAAVRLGEAHTRAWVADPLGQVAAPPSPGAAAHVLVIGPEGGLEPQELRAFVAAAYTPRRLGPHIMRVETAAIVGAAALLA